MTGWKEPLVGALVLLVLIGVLVVTLDRWKSERDTAGRGVLPPTGSQARAPVHRGVARVVDPRTRTPAPPPGQDPVWREGDPVRVYRLPQAPIVERWNPRVHGPVH